MINRLTRTWMAADKKTSYRLYTIKKEIKKSFLSGLAITSFIPLIWYGNKKNKKQKLRKGLSMLSKSNLTWNKEHSYKLWIVDHPLVVQTTNVVKLISFCRTSHRVPVFVILELFMDIPSWSQHFVRLDFSSKTLHSFEECT